MPDLKYFEYAHLPAHLQAASKPFYDFVHSEMLYMSFTKLIAHLAEILPDHLEKEVAIAKVRQAQSIWIPNDNETALRLILEAKDCAVRSLLDK